MVAHYSGLWDIEMLAMPGCVQLENYRPSADILCGRPPNLRPFELRIDTPIIRALGNVHANCGFSAPFVV